MSAQPFHRGLVVALIGMGCCLLSQAAPQMMTFQQAVKKGLDLKGCPKQDVGSIESVYMSDAQPTQKDCARVNRSTSSSKRKARRTFL